MWCKNRIFVHLKNNVREMQQELKLTLKKQLIMIYDIEISFVNDYTAYHLGQ